MMSRFGKRLDKYLKMTELLQRAISELEKFPEAEDNRRSLLVF